jgi:hypothetical protein
VTLQELLDLIAAGDNEALAAALQNSDVDLGELESAALAAFQDIRGRQADGLGAEDLAALEALADGVEAVRAESGRRETVRAEQQAAADAIAARIEPPAPAEGDGEGEGDGAEGNGEGDGGAAAPESGADEGAGGEPGDGQGVSQPEAVAAAGTPPASTPPGGPPAVRPRRRRGRRGPRCSPRRTCRTSTPAARSISRPSPQRRSRGSARCRRRRRTTTGGFSTASP